MGNIINYHATPDTVGINTGTYWNALIRTEQGGFAFAGYGRDTVQHMVFGFVNDFFDSVQLFRYYTPNTFAFQGIAILQYDANTFYVSGVHTDAVPGDAKPVLVKIDSLGNRWWEKVYDQGRLNYTQSITKLANGNLLLGSVKNDLAIANERSNTWLLEVDTGGILIRQWTDSTDSTYVAEGLQQTMNGGIIYGAQKKNWQSAFHSISFYITIVKMDSNFNMRWAFTRGENTLSTYNEITDIEILPNGNIIATGNLANYDSDTALNGYIVKLDTGGHLIWENFYRGINVSQTLNFLNDIDVLPDGSLIAVGMAQDNNQHPSQVGWFLKLDSNGCEIENCLIGVYEAKPANTEVTIYPNPFTDNLQIALTGERATSATFTITNTIGETIYHQTESNLATNYTKMLDLSYLPKGLYFVGVATGDKRQVAKVIKE
jgi:hypothetical protein